jgi:1-phosphatidylinositol-4-phosphate 5-kinase
MNEIHLKNGDRYIGEVDKGGAYNDKGKYIFSDGSYYEGHFEAGKLSGKGIFSDGKGLKIETTFFENNVSSKKSKITYPNGANYEGEISDNKRNGRFRVHVVINRKTPQKINNF